MDDVTTWTPELTAQLRYHVELAARTAAAGELTRSAAETMLVWGVIRSMGLPAGAEDAPEDLPDLPDWPAGGSTAVREGRDLALAMESHFQSEGRHALVDLYERAAGALEQLLR